MLGVTINASIESLSGEHITGHLVERTLKRIDIQGACIFVYIIIIYLHHCVSSRRDSQNKLCFRWSASIMVTIVKRCGVGTPKAWARSNGFRNKYKTSMGLFSSKSIMVDGR